MKGIYSTENPTREQIRKHKRKGKEFIAGEKGKYNIVHLALQIIIDSRTSTAVEFKARLGFK